MAVTTHESTAAAKAAWIGRILGPLLLLLCLVTEPPAGLSETAWATIGLALLMATWWSTEAIPIPATSLLPILLIPALGIDSLNAATAPYANPTIYLFLGGFILGLAMERWNLHKRIALMTLLAMGSKPSRQIAGFMMATAFLSMWVSNTATTIMMLPIGLSVITMLTGENKTSETDRERFATALLLAIAYAASLGGIATLIGTPPNALLAAFLADNYDVQIGFGQWMLLGVPVSAMMLIFTWWWLTRGGFNLSGHDSTQLIRSELAELGPLIESHPRFPARVNAGFMEVVNRREIRLRVFERGTGETLACGTGACAALVASARRGLTDRKAAVTVDGGEIEVRRPVPPGGFVAAAGAAVLSLGARQAWALDLLNFARQHLLVLALAAAVVLAARRSWRIGQKQPVRVIYLGYAGSSQMTCLELMAKKIMVSQSTSGDVPESGLDVLNQDGDSVEVALARQLVAT